MSDEIDCTEIMGWCIDSKNDIYWLLMGTVDQVIW